MLRLIGIIRAWLERRDIEAEVEDELRFHLEHEIEANIARGLTPVDARRQAHADLGGVLQTKEAVMGVRSLGVDPVWSDIRFALRRFGREPVFTGTAVLALALGIGANVAIFSVLDSALFKPLPYADAERLVDVHMIVSSVGGELFPMDTRGRFADQLRSIPQVFDGVSAFSYAGPESPNPADRPLEVGGLAPGFSEFLGVSPRLGRSFTEEDVRAGRTVVISDRYWSRAFGRDADVLGSTLRLADGPHVIVGVMPPSFRYFVGSETDLWRPIAETDASRVVTRLRPGLTIESAQQDLDAVLARPDVTWEQRGLTLMPSEWNRGGDTARVMLFVLLGAVGLLLLIACANVANMLLARTLTRRREIAVRASLGATSGRLVRQFFTEGVILALLGGAGAIVVAWVGTRAVPAMVPGNLVPTLLGVSPPTLDIRVLLMALAATFASAGMCAAIPALRATRAGSTASLHTGQRVAGQSVEQLRTGRALQTIQVAFATVLLVGAGLMVESFVRMQTTPIGFDPDGLAYVQLSYPRGLPLAEYGPFNSELATRMASLPAIRAVTLGPPPTAGYQGGHIGIDGPIDNGEPREIVAYFPVEPDYFEVTGIAIIEGRGFLPEDMVEEPTVVVVSKDVAERFWPGQSPIGKQFTKYESSEPVTIVGVAADTKTWRIADNAPVVYEPKPLRSAGRGVLFRTQGDPAATFAAVVDLVRGMDRGVTVGRIATVEQIYAQFDPLGSTRFYSALLSLLAGLGLATASVGLFGLLSYSVSRRTHEIGVRVALGANAARVRTTVVASALVPVATGLVAGLAVAAWLTRFIARYQPAVRPNDPTTIAAVITVFLGVAAIAALAPVHRATRVDPAIVLRAD